MPLYNEPGLRDAGLGSGMAQSAAEIQQLYPQWQMDYADGATQLQFADWVRERRQMQQAPNAPKIMPKPQGY